MSNRSFQVRLSRFDDNSVEVTLHGLPDACPDCSRGQELGVPFALREGTSGQRAFAYFQCRFSDCLTPFFAEYTRQDSRSFRYTGTSVPRYTEPTEEIPALISTMSPDYVKIFTQAKTAEVADLDLIAGPGYRKALEFLIKDYCILLVSNASSDETEATDAETISLIKKSHLGTIINTYLPMPKVKALASRATWLGNDETHYERRIENGDISVMKSLMKLVIHYIEAEEEAKKLEQEIQPAE